MKTERIDRLTEPLVAGRSYLVPTVTAEWQDRIKAWPVIGPRHHDREFFNFEREHYHVDSRFLPLKCSYRGKAFVHPLHAKEERHGKPAVALGEVVWRRRRCFSSESAFWFPSWADYTIIDDMHRHYAGQQCARGKGGWICPHRKASLGSVQPVDGVITCPLHLLKIDAATGIVLSEEAA